jgi:rubrerythrin
MSNAPNPSTPAEDEQLYLPQLEAQAQAFVARLRTSLPPGRAATPDEMAAAIRNMEETDRSYATYEPIAHSLSEAGLHRLAQRLFEVRKDLHDALNVCLQMYQDAVRTQTEITRMQRESQWESFQVMQETTARQQRAFHEANDRWRATFFGEPLQQHYCPFCGQHLGDSYVSATCPNCRGNLPWRWNRY